MAEGDLDPASMLRELQADRSALAVFRDSFGEPGDALDALAWRLDPNATGISGATNPLSEVGALESIIHARPTDDTEQLIRTSTARLSALLADAASRNARLDGALAILRTLRNGSSGIAFESAASAEAPNPGGTDERPKPQRAPRRLIALVAIVTIGVLAIAGWSLLRPIDVETAGPPSSSAAAPTAPPTNSDAPTVVWIPVGEDLIANPPAGDPIPGLVAPDKALAATALGERSGWTAFGILTTKQDVCMMLRNAEGGTGKCLPYADFVASGLTIDRGSWDVHWAHDGTVTWSGI